MKFFKCENRESLKKVVSVITDYFPKIQKPSDDNSEKGMAMVEFCRRIPVAFSLYYRWV